MPTGTAVNRRGKSPRLAHPGQIGGGRSRKKPSDKHDPYTGRFVAYYCEQCEDSKKMACPTCDGSGIGQWGDPDRSRCLACKGKGVVHCDGDAHWKSWEE